MGICVKSQSWRISQCLHPVTSVLIIFGWAAAPNTATGQTLYERARNTCLTNPVDKTVATHHFLTQQIIACQPTSGEKARPTGSTVS